MDEKEREARILIVEDDPGDVNMIRRFLDDSRIRNKINEVNDGQQALDFLFQREEYSDAPRPDLILLDLNLPCVDGREVLEKIKEDNSLRHIPVVVLTTSKDEADVWRSYNLGASSYITKPVDMNQFIDTIRTLQIYWLKVVLLPTEEEKNE